MSAHGPFKVVRHSWEECSVLDANGRIVATLKTREEDGEEDISERAEPLANLFAAAPDLYTALSLLLKEAASGATSAFSKEQARAAIAKAEGKL